VDGKPARSKEPRRWHFPLQLPVWYRMAGDACWHPGVTASISSTGALIYSKGPRPPTTRILIAISLADTGGCLVGRGRIARTFVPSASRSSSAFAVAVRGFRLDRRGRVLHHASRLAAGRDDRSGTVSRPRREAHNGKRPITERPTADRSQTDGGKERESKPFSAPVADSRQTAP
jgi:hypothetical protein